MPTYVYQCEKCEQVFDVKASIKEKEQVSTLNVLNAMERKPASY